MGRAKDFRGTLKALGLGECFEDGSAALPWKQPRFGSGIDGERFSGDGLGVDEQTAVSEFMYQAQGWSKARRVVVVRHRIKEARQKGRLLLEIPGFAYSAYTTNLTLPALQVRTLYLGRADSENRIRELLQDFAISGFVSQKFWATEAAFRLACWGYNLMSLFRQALLGEASRHTLSTLRVQCFAIGASLGKAGRQKLLRVGLPPPRRDWFKGLFTGAETVGLEYRFRIPKV